MKKIQVRLPENIHEKVKELAHESGISLNSFIVASVSNEVIRQETRDFFKDAVASFDNQAFASAVINLAVKGCLTISEESKAFGLSTEYTLHKILKAPWDSLSKGEKKIFRRLFPGTAMTLKLENENHKKVSSAMEALKDFLKEEYHKATFVNNSGYMGAGVLISIVIVVLLGLRGGAGSACGVGRQRRSRR